MRAIAITTTLTAVLIAATGIAAADDDDDDDEYVYDYWPATGYGLELSAGGGVQSFVGAMQTRTVPGAMWDVRLVLGTRSPIAIEGAYVGTSQHIDSMFDDQNRAMLIGTGFESDVRINFLPMEEVTPYAFAGLGWKRYDVTGADFSTADTDVRETDSFVEVPVGAGLSFRIRGFVADLRLTYRMAAGANLVAADGGRARASSSSPSGSTNGADMDCWTLGARIGGEL
jgi:hypothetical protein